MFQVKRLYYAGLPAVLAGAFTLFSALAAAEAHTQNVCSVPGDHASIQAAVDDPACETVNLGAGTFYESVTISRTVTIQGQGDDLTIVEGDINDGVIFHIQDSGVVTLTGMTLQNLQAGGFGSAILNDGATFVTGCTLSGNSSCFGAGIGGGIHNEGTMTLINSTLSGNSAGSGGGISNEGTMTLTNSIIADSSGGADCSGSMTSLGHNVDSDGSCGLTAAGDLPETDPLLGPLQDNGGRTLTHALLEGSPAIDSGDDTACPATDQRGVPRPQDGDVDGQARCDIGAFELTGGFPVYLPLVAR